ncbi:unnamed protein product [Pleuronectes platessa]|uniref:Uncharacterized protein n=1 Tax=Pleuronectes platessa TaxID=8262 RepID=A0A9N7UJJ8_PLEPL|nr:unnamed protein product [Pleuronectes platessa]
MVLELEHCRFDGAASGGFLFSPALRSDQPEGYFSPRQLTCPAVYSVTDKPGGSARSLVPADGTAVLMGHSSVLERSPTDRFPWCLHWAPQVHFLHCRGTGCSRGKLPGRHNKVTSRLGSGPAAEEDVAAPAALPLPAVY